jgi:flagellin-like protein
MKQNENAVSPVIGVILMVAITVILAAVIASFVFGMAGHIQKTYITAVTIQQTDATNFTLMNAGGQDVSQLDSLIVSGDLDAAAPHDLGITVGSTKSYKTSPVAGVKNIIVVGIFKDGSQQVILNGIVTRGVA